MSATSVYMIRHGAYDHRPSAVAARHRSVVRVHGKLDALVQQHEGQTIVLVVHGGVVEAAFHYFLGFGPGPFAGGYPAAGHTSITLWRRSASRGDWVQEFANDTHHLRGLQA